MPSLGLIMITMKRTHSVLNGLRPWIFLWEELQGRAEKERLCVSISFQKACDSYKLNFTSIPWRYYYIDVWCKKTMPQPSSLARILEDIVLKPFGLWIHWASSALLAYSESSWNRLLSDFSTSLVALPKNHWFMSLIFHSATGDYDIYKWTSAAIYRYSRGGKNSGIPSCGWHCNWARRYHVLRNNSFLALSSIQILTRFQIDLPTYPLHNTIFLVASIRNHLLARLGAAYLVSPSCAWLLFLTSICARCQALARALPIL